MPFRPKIRAFLAAITQTPNVTAAAKAAKISKAHHYAMLKTSPEYAAAFAEALEIGCDALSDVAIERAQIGWDEPIVYQGQFTYPPKWDRKKKSWVPNYKAAPLVVRKIDNALLWNILSRRHPAYQERKETEQPALKAGKVIYQWVPRLPDKSDTAPLPAKDDSTTPPPDSKASVDP